jgi:hypothetical protein
MHVVATAARTAKIPPKINPWVLQVKISNDAVMKPSRNKTYAKVTVKIVAAIATFRNINPSSSKGL